MKDRIRFVLEAEAFEDGHDEILQFRKVSIRRTQSPGQLPNAFDRIEIGIVSGQEIDLKTRTMSRRPRLQRDGMMEAGIIHDQNHFSVQPGMSQQHSQKNPECLSVEGRDRQSDETTIAWTNRPEHGHRLSGRRMKKIGIGAGRPLPQPT